MKFVSLAFASLSLFAQPQAIADNQSLAHCWAVIWSKVPEPLRTQVANAPLVPSRTPPMEILVRSLSRKVQSQDGIAPGASGIEQPSIVAAAQREQILEPKALFLGKAIEVYSKMQAKTLGEGLVSPSGAPLKYDNLILASFLSRQGPVTREDLGGIILVDPKGTKWPLRFSVVGPNPAGNWLTESAYSEECRKLQGFIQAGDWPQAMEAKLRATVRKTSPNEPLLIGLDLLAALDHPAGKEAQIQEGAARLSALMPRNPDALSLCAAAYLAAGKPEFAGRLRAWIAELKPMP